MLKNVKTISLIFASTLFMAIPAMAEEAAHHGSSGLPQFNTATWPSQIFWVAIFFTVLYFVFSRSVLPTLGGTIESRMGYIADNIQKAEKLSGEADALRAEVDAAMKSAGQKANAQISDAVNQSKSNLDAALEEFRSHQESEIATTESRIQSATQSALSDMEQIAASLAAQAAEKIAGIPASESGAESVVKSLSQKTKIAA